MANGQPAHGVNDFPPTPHREGSRLFGRGESFDNVNAFANGNVPFNGQPFGQAQIPIATQYDARSMHSFSTMPDRQPVTPLTPQRNMPQQLMGSPSVASPCAAPDASAIRRPDPFAPDFPTSRNTIGLRTITPSQAFPAQVQVSQQTITATSESPWYAASQGVVSEGWTSDSLTAANLGQHNRQQQEEEARKQETQPAPTNETQTAEQAAAPEAVSQKEKRSTDNMIVCF